ncbi:hypothetical protein BST61_g5904 [Cercospora zeina]
MSVCHEDSIYASTPWQDAFLRVNKWTRLTVGVANSLPPEDEAIERCETVSPGADWVCVGNVIYDCVNRYVVQNCGSRDGQGLCRNGKPPDPTTNVPDDPQCLVPDGIGTLETRARRRREERQTDGRQMFDKDGRIFRKVW